MVNYTQRMDLGIYNNQESQDMAQTGNEECFEKHQKFICNSSSLKNSKII